MNRNEKLAIEVGKLRGDIRTLRKKNSALLIWKLKVDQSNYVEKVQTREIGTQTEDFDTLLRFSDPYQTPLRIRPISKQNSALRESTHTVAESNPIDDVNDTGNQSLQEEHFSSTFDVFLPLETEEPQSKGQKDDKAKRRRSSSLFSYQRITKSASPKQEKITEGLAEKIRDEAIVDPLSSSSSSKKKSKPETPFSSDHQLESRRRSYGETPDRPSRSVKKPVTYKEPSLRVKVRKGFQFFKFMDPLPNAESPSDIQSMAPEDNEDDLSPSASRDDGQLNASEH